MLDLITKLRRLRAFHDYSQEAVAYHLNIAQPTYSDMETGKTHITVDRLDEIASFYGLSCSDLINKSSSELIMLLSEK